MKKHLLIKYTLIISLVVSLSIGTMVKSEVSQAEPDLPRNELNENVTENPQVENEEVDEAEEAETEDETEKPDLISEKLSKMQLISENFNYKLYFDTDEAGIAIESIDEGNIWFSNPPEYLYDSRASETVKNLMRSQISLVYIDKLNNKRQINSFSESVQRNKQFEYKLIENGIRVEMKFGREESRRLLPQVVTQDVFENFILNNTENNRAQLRLKAFYIYYSLEDIKLESEKNSLLNRYPGIEDQNLYVLKTDAFEREKVELENYIKETGFTYEMMEEEYEKVGANLTEEIFPYFFVPIEYVLNEDSLSVRVPTNEIEYDKTNFKLHRIGVMEFFGAEKGDDGYIFIPDGSGALINFNNDSTKEVGIQVGRVYGNDISVPRGTPQSIRHSYAFPVFGLKKSEKAFVSVIEKGDALAEIKSELANFSHSYNVVSANFIVSAVETIELSGGPQLQSTVSRIDTNEYKGDISLGYYFIEGDDADYSGMAKKYRKHLENKGQISKLEQKVEVPFYFEALGLIDRVERVFGIPMNIDVPLTTFDQAYEIIEDLTDRGMSNIHLRYRGWSKGGLNNNIFNTVSPSGKIGGKKNFENLINLLESKEISFFPDADFTFVRSNGFLDGFVTRRDSPRTLNRKIVGYTPTCPGTNMFDTSKFVSVLSPGKMMATFDYFTGEYAKYNNKNLSIGSLGEFLYSDYRTGHQLNREQVKDNLTMMLSEKSDMKFMFDRGNAYVLPFASHILNLPTTSSSFVSVDRAVPFIQIALHGYINYSSAPLNLSDDFNKEVLRSVETGSGIHFVWTYNDNSILKDTAFTNYYSVNYLDWIDKAAQTYDDVNKVLKEVTNQAIVKHEQLQDDLYRTIYENGISIIVNYSNSEVEFEGKKIDAGSFISTRN